MSSGSAALPAPASATATSGSPQRPSPLAVSPLEPELARLIVASLSLEIRPEEIDPEAPLFGEGLGLDSIDALELSLAVSKAYGVKLRSEDQRQYGGLASLRGLAHHIEALRSP